MEKSQHVQNAQKYAEIQKQFDKANSSIQAKINAWYGRFAANNGISIQEAQKILDAESLAELKWDINEYIAHGKANSITGQFMKELENASAKYHISRLEAIKIQTQMECEKLLGGVTDSIDEHLKDQYMNAYYHTAYEIDKGLGVGHSLERINPNKLNKIINKPWAVDQKNFKVRLGESKVTLINNIHNSLTQMCLNGNNPSKAIAELSKTMNGNKVRAGRIIMTESAYFSQVAQKDCFNDLGVEEFEIVATLDGITCDGTCQGKDGEHYPMAVFEAGVTAPPFHPNCRCCTAPYFNDKWSNEGSRIARDENGDAYHVPSNINYATWKNDFVDNPVDPTKYDLINDAGKIIYKHHVEPKQPKEYLTEKKLKSNIAQAELDIQALESDFEKKYGQSYTDIQKVGSSEVENHIKSSNWLGLIDDQTMNELLDLNNQITDLTAQKDDWQSKLTQKILVKDKKVVAKGQIAAEKVKQDLQDELNNFQTNTYSGIWKDDVSTVDYVAKKSKIQAKKDYFEQKILTSIDPAEKQKFTDLLQATNDFEAEGQKYEALLQKIKDNDSILDDLNQKMLSLNNGVTLDEFEKLKVDDAFSQSRKDAAVWAMNTKDADIHLRDKCGEVWRNASKDQKKAIYDYTNSYSKFNEPLRGIEYGTNAYKGVGNVDFDNIGITYGGYKKGQVRKLINDMTDIIEQSSYDVDFWFNRGCRFSGMDDFFNVDMNLLMHGTEAELQNALLGTTPTEFGFCSAGVAKGKGFGGNIKLNIYAPKGTKMMYAEPFSAFGNGGGFKWDGISQQGSFGGESEIILQQGTTFRITKVERKSPTSTIYVDLEVIAQKVQR